jgi:hypothetical protein
LRARCRTRKGAVPTATLSLAKDTDASQRGVNAVPQLADATLRRGWRRSSRRGSERPVAPHGAGCAIGAWGRLPERREPCQRPDGVGMALAGLKPAPLRSNAAQCPVDASRLMTRLPLTAPSTASSVCRSLP